MKSQIIIRCDEKNNEGDYSVEYIGDQLAMQRGVIALLQNDMKFRCFVIESLLHSIGHSEVSIKNMAKKEN